MAAVPQWQPCRNGSRAMAAGLPTPETLTDIARAGHSPPKLVAHAAFYTCFLARRRASHLCASIVKTIGITHMSKSSQVVSGTGSTSSRP